MTAHRTHSGRIFWGLILIVVGVLFLLDRLEKYDFGYLISHYWPVIFIIIGLSIWINSGFRDFVGGFLFIIFGTVFLLIRLDILEHHFWYYFWPVLIIFFGIWLIIKPVFKPNGGKFPDIKEDDLNISCVFSGMKRRVESQNFRGGKADMVFGGLDLDFTAAKLASNQATIHLSVVFGGIEVKVPKDWKVVIDGTPILGAIDDKHRPVPEAEAKATLYVKASAVFGAITIKD
jgi:predicted membrane protein